jgi:hypothetical protein
MFDVLFIKKMMRWMKEENPCIARCLNGQRGKAEKSEVE